MIARAAIASEIVSLSMLAGCATTPSEGRFDFALIGDMPYTHVQQKEYQHVLGALNATDLAFVVHIGDFQFDARPYNRNPSSSIMPCSDESYRLIYESFQSLKHPLILTPGDNDWSDCAPLEASKVDVLERLDKLRTTFYPQGRVLDSALWR